jgi:hypothetical protein
MDRSAGSDYTLTCLVKVLYFYRIQQTIAGAK